MIVSEADRFLSSSVRPDDFILSFLGRCDQTTSTCAKESLSWNFWKTRGGHAAKRHLLKTGAATTLPSSGHRLYQVGSKHTVLRRRASPKYLLFQT